MPTPTPAGDAQSQAPQSPTISVKRTLSPGAKPATMKPGELAANLHDDVIYMGDVDSVDQENATPVAVGGRGAFLALDGDQAVSGSKTFSGPVLVQDPSADGHAVNKKTLDSTKADSDAYADARKAEAVAHADNVGNTVQSNAVNYTDNAKVEALAYADTKKAEANTYADSAATSAKSDAQDYADARKAEAVSYADTKKAEATSHADQVAATAQTAAQGYADARKAEATAHADSAAAAAQAAAISHANAKFTEVMGSVTEDDLKTIQGLSDALNDDGNFATTVTNNIATKTSKDANLSDVADVAAARTNLGLDDLAQQAADNVAITGGSLSGVTLGADVVVEATIDGGWF